MISDFFINSVFDNLKMMESENLKIKQNLKTEDISKEDILKIKNKYDKDKDLFSHLLNGKISDSDIFSFDKTKECKNLLKDIDNILSVMNNNILFDSNKIIYDENQKNNDVYNYLSYKIIKDNIKTLDLEYSLKDVNLFKNNDSSILIKLLELDSQNLLNKELVKKSISKNKEMINQNYSSNEIKVMSEISKYLIGNINDDEMEVMSPILISSRFYSVSDAKLLEKGEARLLDKSGYRPTEGYSQYLRGTQSIYGVSQSTTINSGYYANIRVQSCHTACHKACHGSRSWR